MLMSDTKALSQFILKGVAGEDIVLKSEGTQEFSYSYVGDAVSAILPSFMASASSPWLSGLLVGTLLSASWCAVTRLLGRLW